MKTIFKILFTIELRHDYYNQQENFDDISILPTEKTKRIMEGYRILYKIFSNRLVALIEVNNTDDPFIKISNDTTLRFILRKNHTSLSNISALKVFNVNNMIYYFSNKANNEKDEILYLHKTIPNYSGADEYEVGSLTKNAVDLYEAIRYNSPAFPHNLADNNYWRKLENKRFPVYIKSGNFIIGRPDIHQGNIFSSDSRLFESKKFIPESFELDIDNRIYLREMNSIQYVTTADLKNKNHISIPRYNQFKHPDIYKGNIFFNENNSNYYEALRFISRHNIEPATDINYWQQINIPEPIVSDNSIDVTENIFGVIDLFFSIPVISNYSMLNSARKEVNYVIRIKNRITKWIYISSKNNAIQITDTSGDYSFGSADSIVVSTKPIPLLAKPINDFMLTTGTGAGVISVNPIKCASSSIKYEELTKNFLSEIYLNY